MYALNFPLSMIIWLSPVLMTFLLWRSLQDFKGLKIFDLALLFFFTGFFIERTYYYLINKSLIDSMAWSLSLNPEFMPGVLLDLTANQGFSFVVFLIGGLLGIFIYNLLNSSPKFNHGLLDRLLRIVLPLFFVSEAILILNWDFSNLSEYRLRIIFLLLNFVLMLFLILLYTYYRNYFKKSIGVYSSIVLLGVSLLVLIFNYLLPDVDRLLFNIFNPEQLFCIILMMVGINILLTHFSDKQERNYKKRMEVKQPKPERGFAISFANRRRVSNPLNNPMRKIVKTKNKFQRERKKT